MYLLLESIYKSWIRYVPKFRKNQAALYIQSIIYRKVKNTHMYSKNIVIAKKKKNSVFRPFTSNKKSVLVISMN